jgi:hypothetical protein
MSADFLFVLIGLVLFIPLFSLARRQRSNVLASAVPRAAEIARVHGWVSAGRLMAQAGISEKDARAALAEACRRGLLAQGENGRFYSCGQKTPGPEHHNNPSS